MTILNSIQDQRDFVLLSAPQEPVSRSGRNLVTSCSTYLGCGLTAWGRKAAPTTSSSYYCSPRFTSFDICTLRRFKQSGM